MTDIKTVELLVEAFIQDRRRDVISILEKEIEESVTHGYKNVTKRLRNLQSQVSKREAGYSTASAETRPRTAVSLEQNQLYDRSRSDASINDVILEPNVRASLVRFLREWEHKDQLIEHGINPTNRLLLSGAPGTGKTKLAYAIASHLDFPLILVRLDELISSYLGKTGKNIREIFDLARTESVVIFLDEIDTVAKHRDDTQELGELKRVVTVLLQNIDMLSPTSIVIGATNHEELLDRAIWRRFPTRLSFELPTKQSRALIFELYLKRFEHSLSYALLAEMSEGFNGSTIHETSQDLIKAGILAGSKLDDALAVRLFFEQIRRNNDRRPTKKTLYKMCQILQDSGFNINEIANLSDIPYTTLRDNLSK